MWLLTTEQVAHIDQITCHVNVTEVCSLFLCLEVLCETIMVLEVVLVVALTSIP